MARAWLAFYTTGDPSTAGAGDRVADSAGLRWEPYTETADPHMIFDEHPRMGTGLYKPSCDFLETTRVLFPGAGDRDPGGRPRPRKLDG